MEERVRERVAQWEAASATLSESRRAELAAMTDEEARRVAEALLALLSDAPPKEGLSGLVEQQRLFRRVR
ncbi:MAG: hypothetical protein ACR2MA_11855 [Egibacteraceae bacterium]